MWVAPLPKNNWDSGFINTQNFKTSEVPVLQYVNEILLCAETKEACSRASEDFLNFLAGVVTRHQKNKKGSALSTIS